MFMAGVHLSFRMSKQIAPVYYVKEGNNTYNTTNIGMPHLRHEGHHWWSEGIFVRNVTMNLEVCAFVYSVLRTKKEENEVLLSRGLPDNTNIGIVLLLLTTRSHFYSLHLS